MVSHPFISDYWQYRCNRIMAALEPDDPVRAVNDTLWRSYKEEKRTLELRDDTENLIEVNMFSVTQVPTSTEAIYDWQHLTGTYSHVQRLLAAHASIRCALIESEADKIIGVSNVNLRELTQEQVHDFCGQIVSWWDKNERTFLSPYSRMAHIIRNWLDGMYGEKPGGNHPSLDALKTIEVEQKDVIVQSAISAFSMATNDVSEDEKITVAIIGRGLWSEALAVEMHTAGKPCHQYAELPDDLDCDVVFLMHTHNVINPEQAKNLRCRCIIEVLPDQINPDADPILLDRNIVVVPDVLCTCSADIVEDWWIKGQRVSDWSRALSLTMNDIWNRVKSVQEKRNICYHDAALMVAFERLAERWPD